MNAAFEVTVLGVGDAFSLRHHATALVLSHKDCHLLVDCPDSVGKRLHDVRQQTDRTPELSEVDACLLTHLHGDHVNGLELVAFQRRLVEGRRLKLLAAPEVGEVLWDLRLAVSMSVLFDGHEHRRLGFEDYFDFEPLPPATPFELGPFRIELHPGRHHIPTYGLRVEAAGRLFGYSADTTFHPPMIDFLSPCDLILHEAGYGSAHTALAELGSLPESVRSRMRLVHFPDDFVDNKTDPVCCFEGEILVV